MPQSRVPPRKPRRWPWLVAAVALLFAIWGVRVLLQQEGEFQDPSELTTEPGETVDPVVVPAPANE